MTAILTAASDNGIHALSELGANRYGKSGVQAWIRRSHQGSSGGVRGLWTVRSRTRSSCGPDGCGQLASRSARQGVDRDLQQGADVEVVVVEVGVIALAEMIEVSGRAPRRGIPAGERVRYLARWKTMVSFEGSDLPVGRRGQAADHRCPPRVRPAKRELIPDLAR
ncbi:hypothetical protein ACIBCB_21290 [Streptomyces uncialis]|uniref:hypothetical protein n=1 Tax=Streptomyces uncialis TaxID=1048205 RepID=UPI0037A9EBE8